MDQHVFGKSSGIHEKEGKTTKGNGVDTKVEYSGTIKDRDSGLDVDDEQGQNIIKHELESEKEILEEKLKQITEKLNAIHHADSDSVNIRCHGEANDQSSQNDSSMDNEVYQLFHANSDHGNNNVTSDRGLISSTGSTVSENDTNICPISIEADSHIFNEVDGKTAVETKPCSHDTNLKTVYSKDTVEEETIEAIIPVDHQRGLMPEADRWKIQRHTDYLLHELDALDLINKLYSQFVYNIDDYELLLHILERDGRYKCVMNMLMILSRKGPNCYIQFLVALERCGYTWVIKTLEPDCGIYKGMIKYKGQKVYEILDNTSPKYKEFVKRFENSIEDVYRDKPGQQYVVVKKLEKGCVEVTFHLISLGSNDDEGLRSCLHDVVKIGMIDFTRVKSDSFTFHRITDEEISTERQSMRGKLVKDLENEIRTLKSEIIDLKVENDALKSESVHSTEIQKFKELEANKYKEQLQELELEKDLVIRGLREQLDHEKQDKDTLQKYIDRLRSDNRTLLQDKFKLEEKLVMDEQRLEEENRAVGERTQTEHSRTMLRGGGLRIRPKEPSASDSKK